MSIRFLLLTVAPPLLGVGLGYLLGGRLAGFRGLRIRGLWLVRLAVAVQFLQYSVAGVRHFVQDVLGVPMLAMVFAIVLAWLAINLPSWPRAIRIAGLAIVLGAALNGVVIAVNGRMPYDVEAAAKVSVHLPPSPRCSTRWALPYRTDPDMRVRILLSLAALATLLYTIGAPVSNGG